MPNLAKLRLTSTRLELIFACFWISSNWSALRQISPSHGKNLEAQLQWEQPLKTENLILPSRISYPKIPLPVSASRPLLSISKLERFVWFIDNPFNCQISLLIYRWLYNSACFAVASICTAQSSVNISLAQSGNSYSSYNTDSAQGLWLANCLYTLEPLWDILKFLPVDNVMIAAKLFIPTLRRVSTHINQLVSRIARFGKCCGIGSECRSNI